ncbi:unnamed protein product, partial [Bubo scandiacus]
LHFPFIFYLVITYHKECRKANAFSEAYSDIPGLNIPSGQTRGCEGSGIYYPHRKKKSVCKFEKFNCYF